MTEQQPKNRQRIFIADAVDAAPRQNDGGEQVSVAFARANDRLGFMDAHASPAPWVTKEGDWSNYVTMDRREYESLLNTANAEGDLPVFEAEVADTEHGSFVHPASVTRPAEPFALGVHLRMTERVRALAGITGEMQGSDPSVVVDRQDGFRRRKTIGATRGVSLELDEPVMERLFDRYGLHMSEAKDKERSRSPIPLVGTGSGRRGVYLGSVMVGRLHPMDGRHELKGGIANYIYDRSRGVRKTADAYGLNDELLRRLDVNEKQDMDKKAMREQGLSRIHIVHAQPLPNAGGGEPKYAVALCHANDLDVSDREDPQPYRVENPMLIRDARYDERGNRRTNRYALYPEADFRKMTAAANTDGDKPVFLARVDGTKVEPDSIIPANKPFDAKKHRDVTREYRFDLIAEREAQHELEP